MVGFPNLTGDEVCDMQAMPAGPPGSTHRRRIRVADLEGRGDYPAAQGKMQRRATQGSDSAMRKISRDKVARTHVKGGLSECKRRQSPAVALPDQGICGARCP